MASKFTRLVRAMNIKELLMSDAYMYVYKYPPGFWLEVLNGFGVIHCTV